MSETFLPNEERNARIVADWNQGDVSIANLCKKWGSRPSTIKDILRRARLAGTEVLSVGRAEGTRRAVIARKANQALPPQAQEPAPDPERHPQHHLIARSLSDLTADAYRIVGELQVVAGRGQAGEQNRWFYTMPKDDVRVMMFDRDQGLVVAPQKRIDGRWYLMARLVPVVVRRGRK